MDSVKSPNKAKVVLSEFERRVLLNHMEESGIPRRQVTLKQIIGHSEDRDDFYGVGPKRDKFHSQLQTYKRQSIGLYVQTLKNHNVPMGVTTKNALENSLESSTDDNESMEGEHEGPSDMEMDSEDEFWNPTVPQPSNNNNNKKTKPAAAANGKSDQSKLLPGVAKNSNQQSAQGGQIGGTPKQEISMGDLNAILGRIHMNGKGTVDAYNHLNGSVDAQKKVPPVPKTATPLFSPQNRWNYSGAYPPVEFAQSPAPANFGQYHHFGRPPTTMFGSPPRPKRASSVPSSPASPAADYSQEKFNASEYLQVAGSSEDNPKIVYVNIKYPELTEESFIVNLNYRLKRIVVKGKKKRTILADVFVVKKDYHGLDCKDELIQAEIPGPNKYKDYENRCMLIREPSLYFVQRSNRGSIVTKTLPNSLDECETLRNQHDVLVTDVMNGGVRKWKYYLLVADSNGRSLSSCSDGEEIQTPETQRSRLL